MQPLQLALGHRVEVDATNALDRARALQPSKENLGCTRIGDRPLPQTTLDLRVGRRLTDTAGCAGRSSGTRCGTPAARLACPTTARTIFGIDYISLKIREGVPVTEVAAHVGHTPKSLTLHTYSHVLVDD
jgi:hypothetical protein